MEMSVNKIRSSRMLESCKEEAMEALKLRISSAVRRISVDLDKLSFRYGNSPINILTLNPTFNCLEALNMLTGNLKSCDLGTFVTLSELTDHLILRLPDHLLPANLLNPKE